MEKMQDAASDLRGDAVGRVLEDSLSLSPSVTECACVPRRFPGLVGVVVCLSWTRMGLGVPCDGGNGDEGEGGCAAGGATVRTQ